MSSLIALLLSQASAETWSLVTREDGVTLEARPVRGSDFFEYRATADTDVPVEPLCDSVFEWGTVSKDHDNIKRRRLLEDRGDTRVVYDQLEPPMVAHRDFAFTFHKTAGGAERCAIDFHVSNERAPPLPAGFVRIEKLRGSWRFTRTATGTHVVYTCFADPGGGVPPMFVHGAQRDAALNTLRKGIRLAHAPHARLTPSF